MTPTIRLKHLENVNACNKQDLARLAYGTLNVPFTRIFNTYEGFKVLCRSEDDADKVLSNEAAVELKKIGLQVLVPFEMNIKRSIFIKRLDHIIGERLPEEIKNELEKENKWAKITEVTKIKNYTNMLKIRFQDTKMAEKARQRGLLAYNLAISPDQIEQEEFVNITTCYTCYELDNHQTKECPHTNLTICSECGDQGHTFKTCESTVKRCINCAKINQPANHRTLAMACPFRKKIIREKLEESKRRAETCNNKTYAEIAKRAAEQVRLPETTTQINLNEVKHTKILISIMHAHILNLTNPGTYQIELNTMLQKNNLPTMWFPENPDSGKLLGATFTETAETPANPQSQSNTEDIEQAAHDTQTPQQYNRDPRLGGREQKHETRTRQRSRSNNIPRAEQETPQEAFSTPTESTYPERAEDIGLKICVTGKHIMPTQNPHIEYIRQHIQKGEFKWTYTNTRFGEDIIRHLISTDKIQITKHDFKRVDEGTFRKTRNGLTNRSPPEDTRRTKK